MEEVPKAHLHIKKEKMCGTKNKLMMIFFEKMKEVCFAPNILNFSPQIPVKTPFQNWSDKNNMLPHEMGKHKY